jgi:hypothetical protein
MNMGFPALQNERLSCAMSNDESDSSVHLARFRVSQNRFARAKWLVDRARRELGNEHAHEDFETRYARALMMSLMDELTHLEACAEKEE